MQAIIPVINALVKPKNKLVKSTVLELISPLIMSLTILPSINGTTIKKENFAAYSLLIPNKTDVEIVAPDLEIPGMIAIA